MINRVLIRIKVIQLLYSHLLIENHFMLETQPSAPTKEKRFAYSLYLDILMLTVRIARRIEKKNGYYPLADTRFIKKILIDDQIKSLEMKYRHENFIFSAAEAALIEKVTDSGLFKNFLRDVQSGKEDDQIWEKLMNIIILQDAYLNNLIQKRENYTLAGVERTKSMLSDTFKKFYSSHDNLEDALKILDASMQKSRELYFRLLLLPVELTKLRRNQIDMNRQKFIPSSDDLNPNMRFVDNGLAEVLASDESISEYCKKNEITWETTDNTLLEHLLKKIFESDVYEEYMSFPATDFVTDCEFWRNAFKHIIFEDEFFLDTLEMESVFWNDDLDIIGTFFLKTLKRIEDTGITRDAVMPMYKDEEDAVFGSHLFEDVVRNKDKYRRYIDDCIDVKHWDTERLAFMDVVVIMTALAEIINFPKIPLVVSINEYVEIAKSYSTPKSGGFVNGILSTISTRLKDEGIINK